MIRFSIVIVSLTLLIMIALTAVKMRSEDINYDVQDRANLALISKGFHWAKVTTDGRDVIISGTAPSEETQSQVYETIRLVEGVRKVENNSIYHDSGQVSLSEEITELKISAQKKATTKPAPLPVITLISHERCQDNINTLLSKDSFIFESGSADLSTSSKIVLDELAHLINSCPDAALEISGHTDSTGLIESNLKLSLKRAEAVMNYLVDANISKKRLTAEGYGSLHPVGSNKSATGRQRNRRIEVKIKPQN